MLENKVPDTPSFFKFNLEVKYARQDPTLQARLYPDAIPTRFRELIRERHAIESPRAGQRRGERGRGGAVRIGPSLALSKSFLRSHRETAHRMQMSENRAVVASHGCMAQHAHVRLKAGFSAIRPKGGKSQGRFPPCSHGRRILKGQCVASHQTRCQTTAGQWHFVPPVSWSGGPTPYHVPGVIHIPSNRSAVRDRPGGVAAK